MFQSQFQAFIVMTPMTAPGDVDELGEYRLSLCQRSGPKEHIWAESGRVTSPDIRKSSQQELGMSLQPKEKALISGSLGVCET